MVKQNFMGYHLPSPISNGGWEYHQETSNSGHSNSWSYASEPQDEKENHMGYFSPPQNDSSHYSNGGWEYYQETANSEQSTHMRECPTSPPTSTFENSSSPKYASTQTSTSQRLSKLESMFNRIVEKQQQSRRELEILSQETDEQLEDTEKRLELLSKENEDQLMDAKDKVEEQDEEATASSELSMKNEVVENDTALEVTKEHEHSQPSQTSLESVIEKYEEEMKKYWEEQQTSSIKELLSQMLSAKKGVKEQKSEEVIQENSHSSGAEKYMKEELMEPPIQEALNEENTPKITQQPCLEFKEVKAINKSIEKRIVTKIPRTTFKRRSTTCNPTPGPLASKLNQAMYKRKLAERKPRQGAIAESSPPLRSFLLTNWKKRKKVKNNMPTVGNVSLPCFVFFLCFV
ncbi:hypothetical protein AHAS_Ahas18G0144900 [Arachis hypogaea]